MPKKTAPIKLHPLAQKVLDLLAEAPALSEHSFDNVVRELTQEQDLELCGQGLMAIGLSMQKEGRDDAAAQALVLSSLTLAIPALRKKPSSPELLAQKARELLRTGQKNGPSTLAGISPKTTRGGVGLRGAKSKDRRR